MKSLIVPKTRMITLRQHLKIDLDKDPSEITYHSIISTVKMQGRSAWEYLGKFLTPQYIGTCKSAYTKEYALNRALTIYLHNYYGKFN